MSVERLQELKARQAQLKQIMDYHALYERLLREMVSYKEMVVFALGQGKQDPDLLRRAKELRALQEEVLRAGRACVAFASPLSMREIIDRIEMFRTELADVEKELQDLFKRLYCLNVDEMETAEVKDMPSNLFLGLKRHGPTDQTPIYLDLRHHGNLFFDVKGFDFDEAMNRFLSAFIIALYRSYPLGSLRVLLVDPSGKYRAYYRLSNAFGDGSAEAKAQFSYVRDYDELFKLIDAEKDLILGKFKGGVRDFYDLRAIDDSQRMTYILCLSGLEKALGGYSRQLSSISELFDKGGNYFRCGFRVLGIHDGSGESKDAEANIERIRAYCETSFHYESGAFRQDAPCSLLNIRRSNYEDYVEEFATQYVKEASLLEQKILTLEEVGFGQVRGKPDDPYLSIPVGKSGNEVFYIPFNCSGGNDPSTGGVVGHMILGSSGSGKSSIVHSLILNGCMEYSPDELEFWLLDFKANMMASRYIDTGIPHITRVAPNSKPDDALAILMELKGLIEKRGKRFASVNHAEGTNITNVADYNHFLIDGHLGKYPLMPRIVLCIDEMQEVYASGQTEVQRAISSYIGSIVDQGRAAGIHLLIISQTMDKSDQLVDVFLAQTVGHISFKQTDEALRGSRFRSVIVEDAEHVTSLQRGHAMISFSNNHKKEVKVAYADEKNPEEIQRYFAAIKARYPHKAKLLKIGDTTPLGIENVSSTTGLSYQKYLLQSDGKSCVIGENFINLAPTRFVFDDEGYSSAFVIGSNRLVSSSIMASLFLSLIRSGAEIHAIDGMQDPKRAFSYLFQTANQSNVHTYLPKDIDVLVKGLYQTYKTRKAQKESGFGVSFEPIFVFLHAADTYSKFGENILLSFDQEKPSYSEKELDDLDKVLANIDREWEEEEKKHAQDCDYDLAKMDEMLNALHEENQREDKAPEEGPLPLGDVQLNAALKEMVESGSIVGTFFIVSMSNDTRYLFSDAVSNSRNVVLFNNVVFDAFSLRDSFFLKEVLGQIKADELDDVLAVGRLDGLDYKFKPIIFNEEKLEQLQKLMEE